MQTSTSVAVARLRLHHQDDLAERVPVVSLTSRAANHISSAVLRLAVRDCRRGHPAADLQQFIAWRVP